MVLIATFCTWILAVVVFFVSFAASSVFRKRTDFPESAQAKTANVSVLGTLLLPVASLLTAVCIVWATHWKIIDFLFGSPTGILLCTAIYLVGLAVGTLRLIKAKQAAVTVLWIIFVVSPVVLPASYTYQWFFPRLQKTETGTVTGSKIFYFDNISALIVEGKSIQFTFKHYQPADPVAPFDTLEVEVDGRKHQVSDRQAGNGWLVVDGKRYTVKYGLRLKAQGDPFPDDSVHHPADPAFIYRFPPSSDLKR